MKPNARSNDLRAVRPTFQANEAALVRPGENRSRSLAVGERLLPIERFAGHDGEAVSSSRIRVGAPRTAWTPTSNST